MFVKRSWTFLFPYSRSRTFLFPLAICSPETIEPARSNLLHVLFAQEQAACPVSVTARRFVSGGGVRFRLVSVLRC